MGDGNFAGFGDPTINALGQVAFQATLRNTSASTDTGIYFHNGATILNLVRENDLVPNCTNCRFASLNKPVLNGAGKVAFLATLRNTGGGTTDDTGIYLHNGTALLQIARENVTVTSDPLGRKLTNLSDPVLNANGLVAFYAENPSIISGGIYLSDGNDTISASFGVGDNLPGFGIVTSVTFLTGSAGEDGRSTALDDFGQVAYRLVSNTGSERVFRSAPVLGWRSTVGGQWDDTSNWTLGLRPSAPHEVQIYKLGANVTVIGPANATSVAILQVGAEGGVPVMVLPPSRCKTLVASRPRSVIASIASR